jgi:hypothetical protein
MEELPKPEENEEPKNNLEDSNIEKPPTPNDDAKKETTPLQDAIALEKEKNLKEYISLAEGLSDKNEIHSFSGIDPERYSSIKETEEEFPGYTTPIDDLIERMKSEGFKVVMGKDRLSGNIYILPTSSNNIEEDGLFPQYFNIGSDMNHELKKLILIDKNMSKK